MLYALRMAGESSSVCYIRPSPDCVGVAAGGWSLGGVAGVIGKIFSVHVAEPSVDIRVLVCGFLLRLAHTAELSFVGRGFFGSLRGRYVGVGGMGDGWTKKAAA